MTPRDELRERVVHTLIEHQRVDQSCGCGWPGTVGDSFADHQTAYILREVDAYVKGAIADYVAEREKPMACGHRLVDEDIRQEMGAEKEYRVCAACERERKLVETALNVQREFDNAMIHAGGLGDRSEPTFEDVLREAEGK